MISQGPPDRTGDRNRTEQPRRSSSGRDDRRPSAGEPAGPLLLALVVLCGSLVAVVGPVAGGAAQDTDANFQVTVDTTNSPVKEGETLRVDATVENTGGTAGSQEVTLAAGDAERDATEVALDPGESRSVTFEWATGTGDSGSYQATVSSADDSDSRDVQVRSRPTFAVTVDRTNSPVAEGETMTFRVTVENTGETEDTQDVVLFAGGEERDSTRLPLEPGQSGTVTLGWETSDGDGGDYSAEVASRTDRTFRDVTVQGGEFDVAIEEANSPVEPGETLRVNATVENNGEVGDSQDVNLSVDGVERDPRRLALGPGESQAVTFEWATDEGDGGEYTAEVASEDDTDGRSVRVGSATPTPEPTATAADTPTAAPTGTPASTGTATQSGGGSTGTATGTDGGTSGDGAGPGPLVALAALVAVVALRRR